MIIILVVVLIIVLIAIYAYESTTSSSSVSSAWKPAAEYPVHLGSDYGIAGQACGNSSGYIYCIGGEDDNGGPRDNVYSSASAVSSASWNISKWVSGAASYPKPIQGQSCVEYSGDVYCVGGSYDPSQDDVASSYYAPIEADGLPGTWQNTTAYPIPIDTQSCVASSGYIYCVGGVNETNGFYAESVNSSSVWYAPLSSMGIGQWALSKAYPTGVYYETCLASGGYIYCITGAGSNGSPVSTDYYARLTSEGVGTWTQTTAYPVSLSGQSCAIYSGDIYCVGGEGSIGSYTNAVYYASISSGGIGSWVKGGGYPLSVQTTCVSSMGWIYCMGGFDSTSLNETSATYYASFSSLSSASG